MKHALSIGLITGSGASMGIAAMLGFCGMESTLILAWWTFGFTFNAIGIVLERRSRYD